MKKNLFLLVALLFLTSCGAPTDTAVSETFQNTEDSNNFAESAENRRPLAEAQTESEFQEETEFQEKETEEDAETEDTDEEKEPVRGIYVSAWVAGEESRMDEIIAAMDQTELNTVVIDVKDDEGRIVWDVESPLISEAGSVRVLIQDMPALVEKLHAHGIYVIGRLVCFRDGYIGDIKPEWVIHNPDGSVYRDEKNFSWIDPANEEAHEYLFEVADQCKEAGIDEVQFDYVRYPTKATEEMVGGDGAYRQEKITEFASLSREHFKTQGMPYSMDVFGIVIHAEYDRNIVGQDYASLSFETDALSPMVYPSHYADGTYEIDYPDLHPYEIIYASMTESRELLETAAVLRKGERQAVVRPWLQGFTADYLSNYKDYGAEEIREQIQAVYDAGYEEWLIWDPAEHYPWDAFLPAENGD